MMNMVGIEKSVSGIKPQLTWFKIIPILTDKYLYHKQCKKIVKKDYNNILFAFIYAINKPSGRNATYIIWRERPKCTGAHLDPIDKRM